MKIFYPGRAPAGLDPKDEPWPELRLDQLEAIHRITRELTEAGRTKSVLMGAGMGSGKTVVSAEVILRTKPKRALIVGPKNSFRQWRDSLKDQGISVPLKQIVNSVPGRKNLLRLVGGSPGLYYVGLEMLRAQDWETISETVATDPEIMAFFKGDIEETFTVERRIQSHTYSKMKELDLLISDESHRHSNKKTASDDTIRSIPAEGRIALSGTFYGNKFENTWSVANWLWGKKVTGSKSSWEAKWCIKKPVMTKDGRAQLKTKNGFPLSKIVSENLPGEYVETLPCYVFIATPIGDVPPPEIVKIDLHPEQMRQYEEMETQSLTWIPSSKSKDHEPLVADLPVTQRQRLRTAALGGMTLVPGDSEEDPDSITFDPGCKSSTLTALHEVLHRPDWVGKKVLILTHSKPFAIETARRISKKYSVALKTGEVSSARWEEDKASFMLPVSETDSVQYLVSVISAVGTSTDGLQANCARVVWISEDDNNTNNMQGANRVWRDGADLEDYAAVKIVQRGTIAEGVLSKNDTHRGTVLDSVAGQR